MPKNIILLSDGTGNSNIKNRGTNVYKLYEAIDYESTKPKQVAFYDDGVGTQSFKPLKLLAGAFGWGLSRNVRHLYKELVQAYEPGDKIYLYGFSRGAFTVRTLAGFICNIGILDRNAYFDDERLNKAIFFCYEQYRSKKLAVLEKLVYKPREDKFVFIETKPKIEFMGVWDTVDAVGLPFDEATTFWNSWIFRFKFPDQILNPHVKKAYHALSIDEDRRAFYPLLWVNDKRIEQVWFPGSHGNVGGGHPQQGLSLVTLDWMMKKSEDAGLKFTNYDIGFVTDRKYIFDKIYESRMGFGNLYRYAPRDITKVCEENQLETIKIHECVFERIAQGIFGYAPINIPNTFAVVDKLGTHKNSAAIASLVNTEIKKLTPPSLLGQGSILVAQRQIVYVVFVLYALITFYWLIRGDLANPDIGLFGTLKILVSPDGLLDKLYSLFWHHKIFVLVGVGIFGSGYMLQQKMEGIFAGFWSKLRVDLGKLLG